LFLNNASQLLTLYTDETSGKETGHLFFIFAGPVSRFGNKKLDSTGRGARGPKKTSFPAGTPQRLL